MEKLLQRNNVLLAANRRTVSVLIHARQYTLEGDLSIELVNNSERLSASAVMSFEYIVTLDGTNHLIHPEDVPDFEALIQQSQHNEPSKYSFRIISEKGEVTFISGHGYLKSPGQTEIVDVAFDTSPLGMLWLAPLLDDDGHVTDFIVERVNKMAETQLHLPLHRQRYTELSRDAFSALPIGVLFNVARDGLRQTHVIPLNNYERKTWLNVTLTKLNGGVFIVIQDDTQNRSNEDQIRHQNILFTKIIESSPDIIEIVNLQSGSSAYINKMLLEELNYPFEDIKVIIAERKLQTLIHPDDYELYESFIHQIRTSANEDTVEVQVRWRTYSNTWKWYKTRARIFERDHDGTALKFLGLSQDITQQKLAEEEKKNHQMLKEVEKARTAFFSNVSHEFRTPITLVLAPLQELITTHTLPKAEMEKLQFAHRNTLRLQKLVNSLLDFAAVESGKLQGVFKPTDLAKYTTDLVSNFKSLIEHAGLRSKINCVALDEPIYINREMYEKIVFNLVSNAFKFTFRGRIEVTLKDNKNHVKLIVKDTGVGIDPSNLEKIFERFVRIEGSKARTYEGSGIGLALVRDLVNVHRGSIKVASEPGKGTVFTITLLKGKNHLPAKNIFESTSHQSDTGLADSFIEEAKGWTVGLKGIEDKRRRSAGKHQGNKPLVLVVDDNADMRAYLKSLLEDEYRIALAENGRVAIESISQEKMPDLILSDIMMPEVDGKALLHVLKSNEATKSIPVIMLTAKASEESMIEGLNTGADDYVAKPFSARELLARIDARIEIGTMEKQMRQLLQEQNATLEKNVNETTTDLRNANAQLQRINAELESLNADLSTFAFVASHDLREPLRKIRLFTHALYDREATLLSDKGRDMLQKITSSAERMNMLIEDVLSYSRPYGSEHFEIVDLNTVLEQVLSDLSSIIEEQKATIHYGKLPVMKCNPLQISQLFQNMISNSLKFHDASLSPEIHINTMVLKGDRIGHRKAEKDREYLKLEFSDNGIGFEQAYSEKIFQMFQRLHAKTDYPGTGVGLAICKKIVEKHRGFIGATSEPGKGSTFCCYFPNTLVIEGS